MSISPVLITSSTKNRVSINDDFLVWVESFKKYLIDELEKRLITIFPEGKFVELPRNYLGVFKISNTERLSFRLQKMDDDLRVEVDYIVEIPGKGTINSYNLQPELGKCEIKYLDDCILCIQNLIRDTKTCLKRHRSRKWFY